MPWPMMRSNWWPRPWTSPQMSSSLLIGISQTVAWVSATESQPCRPRPMPSRPISSPGRWKPTTCSSPSLSRATVLKAPSRATYRADMPCPARYRCSPRASGRRLRTISSSRCRSSVPIPAGRHSTCREQAAQLRRNRSRSRTGPPGPGSFMLASLFLLGGPALEPGIDGVMPEHAVVRLEDPVVLVREVQQLAGHALALGGGEGRQALLDQHAVIALAVDDQDRRLPVADVVDRVELLVVLRHLRRGSAVLPLGEPQLLGVEAHDPGIDHAGVVHQAVETVRPVAGDPGHHVAAVAAAQGTGALAVQEIVLLQGRAPALAQVLQRLAAPVLADRIGEGLAVADRTVEVDHHRREPLAGIGLRVPAVVEVVAEAALRAAVDQEGHRVLLPGLVVGRLDHVAVHGLAAPAGEAELLVVAEGQAGQDFLVVAGDLARLAAVGLGHPG